eukprot:gnl/TRDRNA2_/TRDRNA2_158255_c0_seq2.p1 gnl/TRDRNA2_/TRDRNA2_158255_c0~~gnl/TRDRNA2_/TRDRNA2_158255_c0_seq2.p1  ORF type:complete len:324 (+),score=45.12 gnl/TRDRNA2_/TRDRNA2_158255_c0_seq2:46-972(+)
MGDDTSPGRPAKARSSGRTDGPGYACALCSSRRQRWRRRGAVRAASAAGGPPLPVRQLEIAVVVPFRDQRPLQDRQAQLNKFVPYMSSFLSSIPGCTAIIVVVEQSQDGRKFNRGQLLNVGFRLALEALPGLTSFITHDVDLLPSMDMRNVYANPPPESHAVHLASRWPKYTYGTFIGGVLGFCPKDFERVNGYPNNYWGWGLEDDQLALRMSHCGIRPLRVKVGSYSDLDPVNMKAILERGQRDEIRGHLPWYNANMFKRDPMPLDEDWSKNGLRDLTYEIIDTETSGLLRRCTVNLGPCQPSPSRR